MSENILKKEYKDKIEILDNGSILAKIEDWESIRRSEPASESTLMLLYEKFSRRLFSQASAVDSKVRMDGILLQIAVAV